MRGLVTIVILLCLVCMLAPAAMATESAKSAAAWTGTQTLAAPTATVDPGWTTVLAGSVKTSTPQDLAVLFTSETMLGTYVKVQTTKNSNGEPVAVSDTSEACIQVRCLVDDDVAIPGPVTFDNRLVKLSALLGEAIVTDPGTGELVSAGDQWISIYERTKQAHAFNFVFEDVGVGEHTVVIQAKITLTKSPNEVAPEVTEAYLGARTMVCDVINLKTRLYPN